MRGEREQRCLDVIRNDLSMKIIENNLSSVHLSKDLFEKVKQKSIRRY